MADKDGEFRNNLLRMVSAELHVANQFSVSRDFFGKGYFSLSAAEKAAVDQTVFAHLSAIYQALTPQYLTGTQQAQEPMGFRGQASGKSRE